MIILTKAIEVEIRTPPEPPMTILTFFSLFSKMAGVMDDIGILPARM